MNTVLMRAILILGILSSDLEHLSLIKQLAMEAQSLLIFLIHWSALCGGGWRHPDQGSRCAIVKAELVWPSRPEQTALAVESTIFRLMERTESTT